MATTKRVNALTSIGTIADGDYFVGERVSGTTGTILIGGIVYDADFASNGAMTRTAAGVYANRTMTGTANKVDVSNGDGVSGNPTFTISATYAGGTSITSVGTVTTGTWNASLVSLTYGGTNANLAASNGGIIYSTASAMAVLSGTATAEKMLLSGLSTTPTWSTSTIPTSAGATALKHLKSDGTNYVLTTATISDTPSTALKWLRSDGTNWITSTSTLSDTPSTAGKVLVSDGTNWITSTPTFPNTSATARKMIVADGTNWVASTETYAVPGSSGNVMRSDGTNWVAAKAVLTTDVTGVLPVANGGTNASSASVTAFNNITGYTAAGATGTTSTNLVFSTSPVLTTPTLGAATATTVVFSPTTGGIIGTTTNDSTTAGNVGEVITSTVSAVAISDVTLTNITSLSLTAGDWDVSGNISYVPAASTTIAQINGSISTTSATNSADLFQFVGTFLTGYTSALAVPTRRISISGTTTVYLVGLCDYGVSTLTASGTIYARRRR